MATPSVFDLASAQRIAAAVRKVEIGDRSEQSLTFRPPIPHQRRMFRVATFTGAWAINSPKTVTFKFQTSTPNTAIATNLFAALTGTTSTANIRNCGIARDGTAWFLIAAEC